MNDFQMDSFFTTLAVMHLLIVVCMWKHKPDRITATATLVALAWLVAKVVAHVRFEMVMEAIR